MRLLPDMKLAMTNDNSTDLITRLTDLEQTIIDLQSQVAFMDDTIEQLNTIMTAQSVQLDDQQRQLQLLYQKLVLTGTDSQIQPFDLLADRPPHY